jgi:hypothetical protein
MTNKEKIITAFLVSVGVFSASQAIQYVGTLSNGQKKALVTIAKKSDGKILLCSGVWDEKLQNDNNAHTV